MPIIDEYLRTLMDQGGSDLHLTVGAQPKGRVHGSLSSIADEVLDAARVEQIMREITPDWRWENYIESGDMDLAYEIPGLSRYRVNLFKNHWGMGCVLRQIPTRILTLDELALPTVLKSIAEYKEGLILVTGPTGSGKSTTLAAILNHVNENAQKQIITIEDPIEFTHTNKNSTFLHREVGEHSETFERALSGAMRADPDIILIGEMRDRETIKLALSCAAMGMLVFATLHTNNAPKTIDRIVDAFPADEQNQVRIMLADALHGIVSQLLCKRIDGGRVAVHEILLAHEALPHTIRQNSLSNIRNIIDQGADEGMISMDASIKVLFEDGIISAEEAYMKAIEKASFAQHLPQDSDLVT